MRLQKRLSRRVGKKEYVKWIITVPPDEIKKLTWKEGQKLSSKIENDSILIVKDIKKTVIKKESAKE